MSNPFDFDAKFASDAIQERVASYLGRENPGPIHVDLDLTTDCNYRCPHCGDLARKHLNRGGLGPKHLVEVIDDMAALDVRFASLIGGGEPMASPHFEVAVRALHARGISTGVVTNGSYLDETSCDVISHTCDWVRVSLDAASDPVYQKVHRPHGNVPLETVLRGLECLAKRMPGKVGVSYLIVKANVSEIFDAARIAKSIRCAYIRYRAAQHPLTGTYAAIENLGSVREQIARATELEDANFRVSSGELGASEPGESAQTKTYSRCHAQSFGTVIAGDGKVYLCSKWRGKADACIGDVTQMRFRDIWRSAARDAVVRSTRPCLTCSGVHCQAHPYNLLLDSAYREHGVLAEA